MPTTRPTNTESLATDPTTSLPDDPRPVAPTGAAPSTTTRMNPAAAVLWASAFLIGALVIIQAGRLTSSPAYADMSTVRGDYTLLTTYSGLGGNDEAPWEMLFVIDSRDQIIMVYEVENARNRAIFLRDGGSLTNLFRVARGGG